MQNRLNKISVITPVLNGATFIEKAIHSVLNQNHIDFEHIIIDGGSTDGTIEILKKYPHLVWYSEKDSGQPQAMNKGFSISKGKIIVYLNADDYFEPNAFEIANRFLSNGQKCYFIVGGLNMVDGNGYKLPNQEKLHKNTKVSFLEMLQWWRYPVPYNPSAYFYLREVLEEVGPFDETLHFTHDYDFLLRASLKYELIKIEEYLGNYRYIPGTKTYVSHLTNHWRKQMDFSKKYWKYLPVQTQFTIYISYLIGSIRLFARTIKRKIL